MAVRSERSPSSRASVEASASRRSPRGRSGPALAVGLAVAALVLGACTSKADPGGVATVTQTRGSQAAVTTAPSSSSPTPDPAAVITSSLDVKRSGINPTTPISLKVANGKLTSVTMLNPDGKRVTGAMAADGTDWHTTEVLGYSKSYRLTATAINGDGVAATKKITFATLTPSNMTLPYLDDMYGAPLRNGGTYGVGMIPVVHFDESIPNRAAAERALQVTTSPHVDGSWYWADSQDVHWRPRSFYAPGTTVTINAKVYGVNVGGGLYGQSDRSVSFKIGRKQITVAYDSAPKVDKVRVYNNGNLVRTMNTSMGKHGGETVDGKYINFYTLDGTYTVLGFENPAKMCSDTYGLPANAPGGYGCEDIPYGTKISTDGIYLHELDTTVWYQDNGYDVSHGCLNLNRDNAEWFFTHSIVGDPVIIHGAKGAPTLQLSQGGDWTMSWAQWQKGSALQ